MAKEAAVTKEKKDKKDKKEKREKGKTEKRSETEGVHKSKKDKKDKKDKKGKRDSATEAMQQVAIAPRDSPTQEPGLTVAAEADGDLIMHTPVPVGALVPFANPLADDKVQKKVLKSVKKAAKNKSLKRGVKEVVKSLRKSTMASTNGGTAPGIAVLAADISPMDVISHIPVLCEDHGVPYIYVKSRAELGAAGSTKRPTSVVMVSPERGGKKQPGAEPDEAQQEFDEVYKDLLKVVERESRGAIGSISDVFDTFSMADTRSKADIIAERQANLPLPEQPPAAADFNSLDERTVNVGSGRLQSDTSIGDSALREPATADSSARVDGAQYHTETAPDSSVGRQGKEDLDSLPADAVTREARKKV
ncbi:MAG: snoRNA-binding protein [Thelocarpon superellum]|nr:MAG: snoRNA-binding protein [Thelocarpon superellum]